MENAKITSPYCARDKRNSRISCGASAASTCRSRKFSAEESAMTAMAAPPACAAAGAAVLAPLFGEELQRYGVSCGACRGVGPGRIFDLHTARRALRTATQARLLRRRIAVRAEHQDLAGIGDQQAQRLAAIVDYQPCAPAQAIHLFQCDAETLRRRSVPPVLDLLALGGALDGAGARVG